jgi:DNA-binding protein H-NS
MPNYAKMSVAELQEMRKEIDEQIARKKVEEREEVLAEMKAMAAKRGFEFSELVSGKSKAKAKDKLPPKYRNPKDASQTWSGRGRKPNWIQDAMKKGAKIEDFAI